MKTTLTCSFSVMVASSVLGFCFIRGLEVATAESDPPSSSSGVAVGDPDPEWSSQLSAAEALTSSSSPFSSGLNLTGDCLAGDGAATKKAQRKVSWHYNLQYTLYVRNLFSKAASVLEINKWLTSHLAEPCNCSQRDVNLCFLDQ